MKLLALQLLCFAVLYVSALHDNEVEGIFKQTFVSTLLIMFAGAPCPGGWSPFGNFCYLVNSTSMTWHQAQAYCIARGGELVKINSAKENEFVLALARKNAPSRAQVWIGLQWNSIVKNFLWSDLSVPVYKNWAPNEPNGNANEPCSNMWTRRTVYLPYRASGYWNDRTGGIVTSFESGLVCKRLP